MYYFDHAASSWPKPPQVIEAMRRWMEENTSNPGRGSHRMALDASRAVFACRRNLAELFGVRNPLDICFANNTTTALNMAIKGFLREGDHAICTEVEHNSVRRPLEFMRQEKGVQLSYVTTDPRGCLDLRAMKDAFRVNTKLVVVNHSSNLLGTILPVADIAEFCASRGARLLVDAAQTAGSFPIDVNRMGIDMMAFPGHKGLLGPQGTGGLYIHPDIRLEPLIHGGTGSHSEDIGQPETRPDRYEAGTVNTVGIAGLNEGVKTVLHETPEAIHLREWELTQLLMEGLNKIEGLKCLGPALGEQRTGIVAFTMKDRDPAAVAGILDRSYGIAVRAGYHCTPLAHRAAGTENRGAVRASVGYSTTRDQVIYFIQAVREIGKLQAG